MKIWYHAKTGTGVMTAERVLSKQINDQVMKDHGFSFVGTANIAVAKDLVEITKESDLYLFKLTPEAQIRKMSERIAMLEAQLESFKKATEEGFKKIAGKGKNDED